MARTPTRICIVKGCNVSTTGTRCEAHEADRKVQRNQNDPRQSPEWRAARTAALLRDDHTCQWCRKKKPYVKRIEVHHINGKTHDHRMINLLTLCDTCHRDADRALGIRR